MQGVTPADNQGKRVSQDSLVGNQHDLLTDAIAAIDVVCSSVDTLTVPQRLGRCAMSEPAVCYVVREGAVRLERQDGARGVLLRTGDIALLTRELSHELVDVGRQSPVASTRFQKPESGAGANSHSATLMMIRWRFGNPQSTSLLHVFPDLMHFHRAEIPGNCFLHQLVETISNEAASCDPGARSIAEQLGNVLFCWGLRLHMQMQGSLIVGDNVRIDADVAQAAALMARQPEKPWTIQRLAHEVGLSRSVLAERFKESLGQTPMQYLLDCRMNKAVKMLDAKQFVVKEVARQVGYSSTAAFSHAFKRWSGTAPGSYRRDDVAAS